MYPTLTARDSRATRPQHFSNSADDSDKTYGSGLTTSDVDGDHDYRRDCSGFVSMAWHLSTQLDTWQLQSSPLTTRISRSELQPGDVLVDDVGSDNHAVLFQGWNDAAKTSFQYYSFGGTPILHYADGDFSGNISSHPASHYTPYRYNNIVDSDPGVSVMEDGTTDRVFFRGNDGALWQSYLAGGTRTPQRIGGAIIGSPSALYDSVSALLRVFAQGTTTTAAAVPYPADFGPHMTVYQGLGSGSHCLNNPASSPLNNTRMIIYTCVSPDVANQDWYFRAEGNPYYNIWNGASGKCLTVSNASVTNNAAVIQYTCTTGANEEWYVVPEGDYCDFTCYRQYHVINRKSERCLTVTNAATANGTTLLQYDCNDGWNQLWSF